MHPQQIPTAPDLEAVRVRRQTLRAAMGSFEAALAAPAVGRIPEWRAGWSSALGQLAAQVNAHVAATEGPSGFHHEIVVAAPRLHHQVTVLVAEHRKLCDLLDELAGAADHTDTDEQVSRRRDQGTTLLSLLAKHRQNGSDLIYEAYQTDLGGGD